MRVLLVCLLTVTACSHPIDHELTAAEHRDLAALHEARAEAQKKQFDPSLTTDFVAPSPFTGLPDHVIDEYNPTAGHLLEADRELKSAAEHDRAAAKLEAFEDAACNGLPSRVRAACPVLASQIELVQNDSKGVRLTLKPGTDPQDINHRLQCHLAFARANGWDKPTCPLFVRGMSIAVRPPRTLLLHGSTPEIAFQLQTQARRIFKGEQSAPVSFFDIAR